MSSGISEDSRIYLLAKERPAVAVVSTTELCIMAVMGVSAPLLIGIFTDSVEVIATGSKVLRTLMFILPIASYAHLIHPVCEYPQSRSVLYLPYTSGDI